VDLSPLAGQGRRTRRPPPDGASPSAIRFVTPSARHAGEDRALLERRTDLYAKARAANPARWSRQIRNWTPVGDVCLNPERDATDHEIRAAN